MTHWTHGEPIPCVGEADCPPSLHKIRLVWKGYAPVRWYNPSGDWWIPAALELSECLEELVRGRQLRGEVWEVYRAAGKRRTRPIQGRYVETRPATGLWDSFDIVPVVQRRYHSAPIVWDVPNPIVPRVILPVETAPGPGGAAAPRAAAPGVRVETFKQIRDRLAREAAAPTTNGQEGH